ncbi:MAG: hypothetical protein EOP08_17760, partial [Proteobacteria bacterium]
MSHANGSAGPSSPSALVPSSSAAALAAGTETSSLPPLEPQKLFGGVRLLILGGTGFLGKLFWIMLLTRYPNVGSIHLLVRRSKTQSSVERFWSDVATSEALNPLREQHGEGFADFLREKIIPIDGDVSRPRCGIDDALVESLVGKIDA